MTTEELEKKLKISKYTWIHCPTLELKKQVLSIFNQLGLKWGSKNHYIRYTNWDSHREDTTYYPFDGEFSFLEFAYSTGYKIINAEEFIALHTEEEEFDLENYIPKGNLEGFPKEIIARMLDCQEEQGNPRDVTVFEKQRDEGKNKRGFTWENTKEGNMFWSNVLTNKDFDIFFKRYPKQDYQDNSQEFRIGDKVYDILQKEVGVVQGIDYSSSIRYRLSVEFKSGFKTYTINGCYIPACKNPQLLHYRNDYDYSIINFNNLPKRQKPKKWRAKEGETYYRFTSNFEVKGFYDDNDISDNVAYHSGNYFQTKEEAQEVKDKLNKYFQELINPNKQNEETN